MHDFEKKLAAELKDKEYRESYAESFANEYLAGQIQLMRKQRGWTQAELGERIGSNQGRVSVFEDPDYGKWSLDTLRKIASEFGLWLSYRLESYETLVSEAAQFSAARLLRPPFDSDPGIARWTEEDKPSSAESPTIRAVAKWAGNGQPDRQTLIGWLQGAGLPDFNAREATPAQHLREAIPPDDPLWDVITREIAALISAPLEDILPLVRNSGDFWESLFRLAVARGPLVAMQDALDTALRAAELRWESNGSTGLGYTGDRGLLEAMIYNQTDRRWKEVWYRYLSGGEHPDDFTPPAHPFLPGDRSTGIRGLLGLPGEGTRGYWCELALGIRTLELRLLERDTRDPSFGFRLTPGILDELCDAVGTIYDWYAEPLAAQNLFQGSIDLIGSGGTAQVVGWNQYAAAAWAFEAHQRPGWTEALCANPSDRRRIARALLLGLDFFEKWQKARTDAEPDRLPREWPGPNVVPMTIDERRDSLRRSVADLNRAA
jgi:transcriptional regulator with XRE-family HTH domain